MKVRIAGAILITIAVFGISPLANQIAAMGGIAIVTGMFGLGMMALGGSR